MPIHFWLFCLTALTLPPSAQAGSWLEDVAQGLKAEAMFNPKSDHQTLLAEFQGEIFPLEVTGDEAHAVFEIKSQNNEVCFELTVTTDSEGRHGYVDLINTEYPECHLPARQRGTFILKLVDFLSLTAELPYVRITDESRVRCHLNEESVALPLLRILQKGQSWYGSHGYLPEASKREEFESSVRLIREFSLQDLKQKLPLLRKEMLNSLRKFPRNLSLKYAVSLFERHPFEGQCSEGRCNEERDLTEDDLLWAHIEEFESDYGPRKTVAQFLSWIWEIDCTLYSSYLRLIFPRLTQDEYERQFTWLGMKARIERLGIHLTKSFPFIT